MDIEIIEEKNLYIKFKVKGEDYTLGNILQKALLNDKRVLGAGFYIPHPLRHEMTVEVFFNENTNSEEKKKIIIENMKNIRDFIENVKKELNIVMEEHKDEVLP